MNNQKPQPYAYVLLAVAVIAALCLLPVVWKIGKWAVKVILTVAIIGFAVYGAYIFFTTYSARKK